MAASAIIRRSASSPLLPCARGGRRFWHAPAPTRYRFALRGGGDGVPPFQPYGGGRRAPELSYSHSSLPDGQGEASIWRFLQTLEKHLDNQSNLTNLMVKEQRELMACRMFKGQKKSSKRRSIWNGFLLFSTSSMFSLWCYGTGTEVILEKVDAFFTTRVNKIVTDPEIQRNLRTSANTYFDDAFKRLNPWFHLKRWWSGDKKAPESTAAEMFCHAMFLLGSLRKNPDEWVEEGKLVQLMKYMVMGEEDVIKKTLEMLTEISYIEKRVTTNAQGASVVYYRSIQMEIHELHIAKMQSKIKKCLGLGRSFGELIGWR
ncbi:hypothetical protein ACP70R_015244 [Stipagrostis hirtigluma subsp. patula]